MREALSDPLLLGKALPGDTWALWRTLLIASMGEPLNPEERELFAQVAGRQDSPSERVDEFWSIVGRRGGKTRAAGTLGAYISTLCDWSDVLAPGERGVLPVLAASTSQADRAFQHIAGVLQHSPTLCEMIEGEPTADTIKLSTNVDIQIKPANFRTIRGITSISAIADEVAFWHVEGSRNPDSEIIEALLPSLATTGGMLIVISSPYARRGELYRTYRQNYGPTGDPSILVTMAASRVFNPGLPEKVVRKAYARNPAVAAAEYGGAFRTDVEMLLSREVVEGAVQIGVSERGPTKGNAYFAFVDPSGGSNDSMTLAVAHREGGMAVLDVTLEQKPPFSPDATVASFSKVLKSYGLKTVTGDRYAGEWPRERFRQYGVTYEVSEMNKSEIYGAVVPAFNSGSVTLLDDDVTVDQFVGLERRTGRSGRDTIDHAPNAHDDVANAVAGALVGATGRSSSYTFEDMKRAYA
ncbi:hypothetical protein [Phyllobacterium phragmitis]|nr:hypothetical protein [Phyllobacterium phragmitis]